MYLSTPSLQVLWSEPGAAGASLNTLKNTVAVDRGVGYQVTGTTSHAVLCILLLLMILRDMVLTRQLQLWCYKI